MLVVDNSRITGATRAQGRPAADLDLVAQGFPEEVISKLMGNGIDEGGREGMCKGRDKSKHGSSGN